MKTYHRHVNKNVGMNPIAQAVARSQLRKAIVDQKIALYMLNPGETCATLLSGCSATMQVVYGACLSEGIDTVAVRILKGGLNACIQVMLADSYDVTQTVAIANGLDKAMDLAAVLKPQSINNAWMEICK